MQEHKNFERSTSVTEQFVQGKGAVSNQVIKTLRNIKNWIQLASQSDNSDNSVKLRY